MRHTRLPGLPSASKENRYQQMRRSGELLTACVLLVLALPLLTIVAVLIKWDGGPVFERRWRIGPGERRFQVLSFRTTAYRPGESGSNWQPTPLGQFLKLTRMDALPQLFSVMRGHIGINDMTLFD